MALRLDASSARTRAQNASVLRSSAIASAKGGLSRARVSRSSLIPCRTLFSVTSDITNCTTKLRLRHHPFGHLIDRFPRPLFQVAAFEDDGNQLDPLCLMIDPHKRRIIRATYRQHVGWRHD